MGGLVHAGAVDAVRPLLRHNEERAAGRAVADAHAREDLEGRNDGHREAPAVGGLVVHLHLEHPREVDPPAPGAVLQGNAPGRRLLTWPWLVTPGEESHDIFLDRGSWTAMAPRLVLFNKLGSRLTRRSPQSRVTPLDIDYCGLAYYDGIIQPYVPTCVHTICTHMRPHSRNTSNLVNERCRALGIHIANWSQVGMA